LLGGGKIEEAFVVIKCS